MVRSVGAINLRSIIIIFAIVFLALSLGRVVTQVRFSQSLFLIFGLIIAFTTFFNTNLGILAIIFSMLLSPEFKVGVIPGRDIVLRLEDFLLIIVTFTWLAKTAVNKELSILRKTPLNFSIGIYIFTCIILTLRGMLLGAVIPIKGIFYLLKYIEYFILYFMVLNQVRTRRQRRLFVIAFLLTCTIVCTYAGFHIGTATRLSAPFEGAGEPNTFGGYLMFMLAIVTGLFLYSPPGKAKLWLGGLALFIVPNFLLTLSRTSYIAIIPMMISLIIFGPRKWTLTATFSVVIIFFIIFTPYAVERRIEYTFSGEVTEEVKPVTIGRYTLDPSASARIRSWQEVMVKWKNRPLLGYGVTGLGFFVDGQYVRILGELGLLGLLVFLFLLWSIFKHSRRILLTAKENFSKGLSLGFLAGFIGIVFFNGGANGFIITRIMEPFWFMAAIVSLTPELEYYDNSSR